MFAELSFCYTRAVATALSEQRQLNLGLVPAAVIDGLDYWAERFDLSRAQLARRILVDWVAVRFEHERLQEQIRAAYAVAQDEAAVPAEGSS